MVTPQVTPVSVPVEQPKEPVAPTLGGLHALLEKNLKWSQIIYEQNRKINNKLLWSAIASWLRFLIIAIPLTLGIIFLPAIFRGLLNQYQGLLNYSSTLNNAASTPNTNDILKILPLNAAQREQLKQMIK